MTTTSDRMAALFATADDKTAAEAAVEQGVQGLPEYVGTAWAMVTLIVERVTAERRSEA